MLNLTLYIYNIPFNLNLNYCLKDFMNDYNIEIFFILQNVLCLSVLSVFSDFLKVLHERPIL